MFIFLLVYLTASYIKHESSTLSSSPKNYPLRLIFFSNLVDLLLVYISFLNNIYSPDIRWQENPKYNLPSIFIRIPRKNIKEIRIYSSKWSLIAKCKIKLNMLTFKIIYNSRFIITLRRKTILMTWVNVQLVVFCN